MTLFSVNSCFSWFFHPLSCPIKIIDNLYTLVSGKFLPRYREQSNLHRSLRVGLVQQTITGFNLQIKERSINQYRLVQLKYGKSSHIQITYLYSGEKIVAMKKPQTTTQPRIEKPPHRFCSSLCYTLHQKVITVIDFYYKHKDIDINSIEMLSLLFQRRLFLRQGQLVPFSTGSASFRQWVSSPPILPVKLSK